MCDGCSFSGLHPTCPDTVLLCIALYRKVLVFDRPRSNTNGAKLALLLAQLSTTVPNAPCAFGQIVFRACLKSGTTSPCHPLRTRVRSYGNRLFRQPLRLHQARCIQTSQSRPYSCSVAHCCLHTSRYMPQQSLPRQGCSEYVHPLLRR